MIAYDKTFLVSITIFPVLDFFSCFVEIFEVHGAVQLYIMKLLLCRTITKWNVYVKLLRVMTTEEINFPKMMITKLSDQYVNWSQKKNRMLWMI